MSGLAMAACLPERANNAQWQVTSRGEVLGGGASREPFGWPGAQLCADSTDSLSSDWP